MSQLLSGAIVLVLVGVLIWALTTEVRKRAEEKKELLYEEAKARALHRYAAEVLRPVASDEFELAERLDRLRSNR